MKKIIPVLFAVTSLCYACNNTASVKSSNDSSSTDVKDKDGDDDKPKAETQLLNNISLKTEGDVEVYRAFLAYEDGNLVPSSNKTSLGKPIYVNLNITKGWKVEDGMVSLGATEKITTDNGTLILESDDLFPEPIKESNANIINLKALINNMSGPIEYFIVDFKVWDKKGNGVITGSYKFYVE